MQLQKIFKVDLNEIGHDNHNESGKAVRVSIQQD